MPRPTASRSAILGASFAIYLVWGSAYLAMKIGLRTIPPLLLASVRLLLAGSLMGGFALLRGHRPERVHFRSALIAGGLLFLGGHGLLYWGQVRLPSGLGAVLYATIPLWVVLIEGLSPTGIHLGARSLSGLGLGTLGVLVLVAPARQLGRGRADLPGAIAIALASLCWAVGSIYTTRARLPRSAALAGGMELFSGGVLLLAAAAGSGELRGFHLAQVAPAAVAAIGFLVCFSSMIGFSCYLWLLKVASPARVSTYAYITPLVAVGLGWGLAGEAVTGRTGLAIALLLAAVSLIVRAQSKRPGPLLAAEGEGQAAVAGT